MALDSRIREQNPDCSFCFQATFVLSCEALVCYLEIVSSTSDCIYGQVPLYRGPIYHDITYGNVIIEAESESDIRITTVIPLLALTGKLWGGNIEDFGEN